MAFVNDSGKRTAPKAPRKVRPIKAPPAPVIRAGDSPGTRKADFKRADAFKKTPTFKRSVRVAKAANRSYKAQEVRANHKSELAADPHGLDKARKFQDAHKGHGLFSLATIDNLMSGKTTAGVVHGAESVAAAIGAHATGGPLDRALGQSDRIVSLAQNFGKDLVDIPANAVPSVYVPLKTAVQGHPGKAAGMLAQPFVDVIKHPAKSFTEHPLGTALLIRGGEGAIGHGAGKTMRTVGTPRMRKLASTERTPATVPGTHLVQDRRYSKDVIVKAGQVAAEKRAVKKGKPTAVVMKSSQIKGRVDASFAASEDIRRINRANAVHAATEASKNVLPSGPKGLRKAEKVKPSAATTLIVQNAIRPTREGLVAHLEQLKREATHLKGDRLRANLQAQKEMAHAVDTFHPVHTPAAAARVAALSVDQQAGLVKRGLLDPAQAEKARLIPYAVQRMGAKHNGTEVVDHNGIPLSTADIRAHMKAHGAPEPGFVSNAPNQRGAKNFFIPTHEAPSIGGGKRTGAAIREGTADLHPDTLTEGAARAQGLMDAHDRYAKFVHEFAVRKVDGKTHLYGTYKQASAAARDGMVDHNGVAVPHAVSMRPIRINAFAGKADQLKQLLDVANSEHHPAYQSMHDATVNALEGHDNGKGPYALVPADAASRMQEHINTLGPGPAGRVGNLYGSTFRKSVLATSPKWLTGNVVEAATRAMFAHAGPRSYVTGRKALQRLDQIDPAAGLEAHVRTVGGGHYSLVQRSNIHSSAEQFAGTKLAGVAKGLENFWRKPGPKQTAGAWHAYTDFVFNTLNGKVESQFQTAMLGKALRDSPLMSSHANKMSKTAIDEAARGMRDTNAQVALGREVDRMYGRYSKFSPGLKRMVQAYTPFIAWTLNATQFVLSVLPRDHPVATSLIASSSQASEQWRKQHGMVAQGLFGGLVPNAAPAFLQGSIPGKNGSHLRASRYVPFGAFDTEGASLAGTYASGLLPQFSSILANLQGKDWKGKDLPPGDSAALHAALSLIEGSVPAAGQVSRLAKGQGSMGSRLNKEFNPLAYTKSKQGAGGAQVVVKPRGAVMPSRGGPAPLKALPPLKALKALPPLPPLP